MTINRIVIISLFTSLTVLLSIVFPSIPISALNISLTLQTLMVMLVGGLLRPVDAFISLVLYIGLGVIGLPVFSGLQSGFAPLVGPTGGFIVAFPLAAFMISLFRGQKSLIRLIIINIIFGIGFIYLIGSVSLTLVLHQPYHIALLNLLLFIPGDLIKVGLAAGIVYKLKQWPILNE